MAPLVVMRPILLPLFSVNQRLPSGPDVIANGWLLTVGTINSVMAPFVVMRAILSVACSVNQRLPSGPDVICWGLLPDVGTMYSVIDTTGTQRSSNCSSSRRGRSAFAVFFANIREFQF